MKLGIGISTEDSIIINYATTRSLPAVVIPQPLTLQNILMFEGGSDVSYTWNCGQIVGTTIPINLRVTGNLPIGENLYAGSPVGSDWAKTRFWYYVGPTLALPCIGSRTFDYDPPPENEGFIQTLDPFPLDIEVPPNYYIQFIFRYFYEGSTLFTVSNMSDNGTILTTFNGIGDLY